MKKKEQFSLRSRGNSFKYALAGIKAFFISEHNAWIHLLATAIVILLAIILHVSNTDAISLTLAVGFVWVSELFNTAIEKIMDFISVERSPQIKFIKDISAGAVLVAAITALIVGCMVFIPKIIL